MLFVAICATSLVWADESGNCGDNVNYTFEESTGTLTISGAGDMTSNPWVSWESHYSSIKTVVVESGVTSIGAYAFNGCNALTNVTIPNSVTRIEELAFGYTGLTNIEIPNSVTYIERRAFEECDGLISVNIPNSVTVVGDFAFAYCDKLTYVNIPNSVESIGMGAFVCCDLGGIYVDNGNPWYYSNGDCLIDKKHEGEEIVIAGCNNYSVTIPNSVTSIGSLAFGGCYRLPSVTIPNSVVTIGLCAFSDCSGLTSVTIPNSVTSIGNDAFFGCSGLTNVTIPNSVTNIGWTAFAECSGLTSVTLPNNGISVGPRAFVGCSGLTNIEIPSSTNIGSDAFKECDNLVFNTYQNANYLGNNENPYLCLYKAMSNDITNCVVNENCESIVSSAFDDCSNITNIIIPNSVSSIGEGAFRGCSGLVSIISNAITPPAYFDDNEFNAFDMVSDYNIPLYVPAESIEAYRTADVWKKFTNIRGVDDAGICGDNVIWTFDESTGTLTISGAGPMYDFVDENYTYLNNCPWSCYSSKIKEIVIEEGVTSIGNGAFESCSELENISIPNTVGSIGWYALGNCKKLTSIEIPESVMSIEWFAFDGCSGLENISASGGRYYSLDNCLIDNYSHMVVLGCKNSVIPEDGVDGIDRLAFSGCTGLTEITIPENVSWIRFDSFCDCTGLTAVTVKATTPPVYETYNYAFSNYDIPLYVPAESIEAYRTADVWANFTNILPIPIPTTGFNEVTCEKNEVRKMLIDGTVYVEKDGVRYNLNAQKIR